jgi:hypothetical protein
MAALAATWPRDRGLLVIELDPAGGDLGVRFDLPVEPGLVTLAAAGRRELDPETLLAHTHPLPRLDEGAAAPRRLLASPVSQEQTHAALSALRGRLTPVLTETRFDVLVDCGRLDHGSPVQRIATEAELLVVVVRPVVADVHHLSTRLDTLSPRNLSLLLVGERPYTVEEVAEAVGAAPLGTLPDDPKAAAGLTATDPASLRTVRRSALVRSARAVAERLAAWMAPSAGPPESPESVGASEPSSSNGSRPVPAPAVWPTSTQRGPA